MPAPGGHDEMRRVGLDGPSVVLPAGAVQTLALALHELATNAVKYGALAGPQGRLDVSWQLQAAPDKVNGGRLHLAWVERGVSVMQDGASMRRGYGRELIEMALPYELDARTQLEFTANGVRCVIELPLPAGDASQQGKARRSNGPVLA